MGAGTLSRRLRLAYRGTVIRRLLPLVLVLAALSGPGAEEEPRRLVFSGRSDEGEVWANVGLTMLRLDEDYLPMVVAVVNRAAQPVVVDRDAIRLVGPDGLRYPMPTIRELRRNYGKLGLDTRAASAAGIPWELWVRDRKLVESNFFPDLMRSRRGIAIDEVSLGTGLAMVDRVYFARPPGLGIGTPFLLEVAPVGWQAPIRVGIVLR